MTPSHRYRHRERAAGGRAPKSRYRPAPEELHLSRETVGNHIRRLLHSVGAHSRLEAVALARGEALAGA